MKVCEECGREFERENYVYCPVCAKELDEYYICNECKEPFEEEKELIEHKEENSDCSGGGKRSEGVQYCSECGEKAEKDDNYCLNCGTEL